MKQNLNKDINKKRTKTNNEEDLTLLKEEIVDKKNKKIVEKFLSKMLNKEVKIKEYLKEDTEKTKKEKIVSLLIEIDHLIYKLDLNQIPGKNKKNIQIKKEDTE